MQQTQIQSWSSIISSIAGSQEINYEGKYALAGSRKHIDITEIITLELPFPTFMVNINSLDAINPGELSMNGQT